MTHTSNIENTYGKSFNVAVANTYAQNVIESTYLPKSSIIISTEYDGEDIGHTAMLMTDQNGNAATISNYIIEKNGLHSNNDNPNVVSLKIDNKTIVESNDKLSINVTNFIDNSSIVSTNNNITLDSQSLTKTSNVSFGVGKGSESIIANNGTIYVNTEKLDLANGQIEGIVKGDGKTISVTNGVASVNTNNLQKASNSSFGVAKVDNNYIISNDGKISLDKSKFKSIESNGRKMHKADNSSIVSNDGIVSVNTANLKKASNNSIGFVKIDPQTLEIDNGSLKVKNLDQMFTFVYDYEDGMTQIESKISQIRDLLNNNVYVNAEPEIRHFTCNETTASILAKPEYLEEPINMEIQHVYVSLNVITNCDFVIDIIYDNNIVPNIELESINYNDEFTITGIDCLEHVWPSTGMKEKTIVLLFTCKNFFSTTGPKTDITKLSISASAYADNTRAKKIVYSIIRYNSFYKEDDTNNEPEQETIEYSTEYVADEKNSKWYIVNVEPGVNPYWNKIEEFSETAAYIIRRGSIGGKDKDATITINQINSIIDSNGAIELYLRGVYIHRESGKSYSFLNKLPVERFNTTVTEHVGMNVLAGRGVYDYPFTIGFDTLYFQIRYQVDNSTQVRFVGNLPYEFITHHGKHITVQAYIQDENDETYQYFINNNTWTEYYADVYQYNDNSLQKSGEKQQNKCILNSFFKIIIDGGSIIYAMPSIDTNNNVEYKDDNNNVYATLVFNRSYNDNEFTVLYFDTNFTQYNINDAQLYFIDPDCYIDTSTNNISIADLFPLLNANQLISNFEIDFEKMQYDTKTLLYNQSDSQLVYGENPNIVLRSEFLYAKNDTEWITINNGNNEDLSNTMIDCYIICGDSQQKLNNDSYYRPVTINAEDAENLYTTNYNNQHTEYIATITYNFSYIENGVSYWYWDAHKTCTLNINMYSNPKLVTNAFNISLDDNNITLTKNTEGDFHINGIYTINDTLVDNVNNFATHLLISYTYGNKITSIQGGNISLDDNDCIIVSNIPNTYYLQTYVIDFNDNAWNLSIDSGENGIRLLSSLSANINMFYDQSNLNKDYTLAFVVSNDGTSYSNIIYSSYHNDIPYSNETIVHSKYKYFDDSNIYSYFRIENLENHHICYLNGDTYIRTNTYISSKDYTDINISLAYDTKYTKSIHGIADANAENFVIDFNEAGYDEYPVSTGKVIAYLDANSNKYVFKLGEVTANNIIIDDLDEYINAYVCFCVKPIDENLTSKQHKLNLYFVQNPENKTIIYAQDQIETVYQNKVSLNIEIPEVINDYLNHIVYKHYRTELFITQYGGESVLQTNQMHEQHIFDMYKRICNANNVNGNIDNLYLYDTNGHAMTFVTIENNLITYTASENFNYNDSHYIYETRCSDENSNATFAYAYDIPNLFNISSYCSLDVYDNFVVPKFTKEFDNYFTPYDFKVIATIDEDETNDYLNKKIELNTNHSIDIKLIYVSSAFNLSDNELSILASYNTENYVVNFDNVSYLSKTCYGETNNIIKACSYTTYSSIYAYAYTQAYTYVDTRIIEKTGAIELTNDVYCIPISSIPEETNIIDEEKQFYGNVYAYLFKPNAYLWNLHNYDSNSNAYEFNIAKINNQWLSPVPTDLIDNYNVISYTDQIFNYDSEGPLLSSSDSSN